MPDTIEISPKARLLSAIFALKQADLDRIEAEVGYAGGGGACPPRSYFDRLQDHRSYARAIDDAIEVVRAMTPLPAHHGQRGEGACPPAPPHPAREGER